MNCRKTQSLLSAYLDMELTGEEMLVIRHHLGYCSTCRSEHDSLRMVKKLLGAMDQRQSDAVWAELLVQNVMVASRPAWYRWKLTFAEGDFGLTGVGFAPPLNRGRRLSVSLALSALTVLLLAVPFESHDMSIASTANMASIGWMPELAHRTAEKSWNALVSDFPNLQEIPLETDSVTLLPSNTSVASTAYQPDNASQSTGALQSYWGSPARLTFASSVGQ